MGRASRHKREHHVGRTVQVWNERTREFDTFHNVTVSDQAVREWAEERWIELSQGHPDRPPDIETPHFWSWSPRPGDPDDREGAAPEGAPFVDFKYLVGWWHRPFRIPAIVVGSARENVDIDGFQPTDAVSGIVKAAVERRGQSFRAAYRVILEGPGKVEQEEALLESEESARAWIRAAFEKLPGAPLERTYVDPDELRREAASA